MKDIDDWPLKVKNELLDYLRWNSYCSERYRIFYVATPKVACTSLKWWFADLEGYSQALRAITDSRETDPDLVIHDNFYKVAGNVTGLLPDDLFEPLTSDTFFRFAVVRNPYHRIFSAWQSKLLLQEPLQIEPYRNADFFHHPIECAGDIAAAFEGFLEYLAINEVSSYKDIHWTPQVSILCPDLINYTKLVKIENTDEFAEVLLNQVGPDVSNPFASHHRNESLIPYVPEFVTKRSAELIRMLYAEDFDTFGYDKQPPEAEQAFSSDQLDIAIRAIKLIRKRHQRLGECNLQIANLRNELSNISINKVQQPTPKNQASCYILHCCIRRVSIVFCNDIKAFKQMFRSFRWVLQEWIGKCRRFLRRLLPESVIRKIRRSSNIEAEIKAIRESGLFDASFYLAMYRDIKSAHHDAIRHYCEVGWHEGRDPSDNFNTSFYLATYSDIRNAGINPFWHYVVAGASELRHAVTDSVTHYEDDIRFGIVDTDIKLLAFYSFPNWDKLRSGASSSKGGAKLLLPHEVLGFYDLMDWRVLEKQAQIAKRHGLYGFCFQLSAGRYSIESTQLIDLFHSHEEIDFRFCVQVCLHAESLTDKLIASVSQVVTDKRYICIDSRPVVLVTLPDNLHDAIRTLSELRQKLADHDVKNIFLIGQWIAKEMDAAACASVTGLCDAMIDLPFSLQSSETGGFSPIDKNGVDVVPYRVVASQGVARAADARHFPHPIYHVVTLDLDNTGLGLERSLIYSRFHLKDYRRWLDAAISNAKSSHLQDRRFVFVNAWNDWNNGLFVEPDRQSGFSRINETTRALMNISCCATMPKVSIIVPNFNHERFLRRRLDSIYGQTYKNIEVILLDDCSSDQSRFILDQYAKNHSEITRKLYGEKNSGSPFRQWAKGIGVATGDLVWIAESDDFCDEHFLEKLVRCFDDEAVMLAYAKSVFVTNDETPMCDEFSRYLGDLECRNKWNDSYVETAHNEVRDALGIKNTIPNVSSVLFKRPVNMPLLEDESWLSMAVAGDWVFYLHLIRGGKIAYSTETTNFFRQYEDGATEATYKKETFYRELAMASQAVQLLYILPSCVIEQSLQNCKSLYDRYVGRSDQEFSLWYDRESIVRARENRLPNVMVSTMGFYPGGAEILPIRMANEFKQQGLSVLLLSAGFNLREDRVRRMLRNDIPVIEVSDVEAVKSIIHDFGIEVLNSHQWHIQKYPLQLPDVFSELCAHVATLHGMIEHGNASDVTEEELRIADKNVTTWVYTADKNLGPFFDFGLCDNSSRRFIKMPNGMQPPNVIAIPRLDMNIPEESFVLCCVSRAIPDKGWAEMIMAVEHARTLTNCDIRLILVGNGVVYDEYCRVGVPHFVHLAGFSENSVGYYAAADMGIMLTKFKSESFPLTIVDCLFAGKPYIASDVGDIRNMLTINDAIAGEVIALDNWEVSIEIAAQVIADFATDKQKYLRALASVQDAANRYRIDVVAKQYVHIFENDIHLNKFKAQG